MTNASHLHESEAAGAGGAVSSTRFITRPHPPCLA
jgi:hypothetical protein